ncbi:hypothetical protein Ajs_2719 [Acidovorax sp. JS42]|nr:hypothetical protein Ajs_2719 [Acidovorax sp. JS42]
MLSELHRLRAGDANWRISRLLKYSPLSLPSCRLAKYFSSLLGRVIKFCSCSVVRSTIRKYAFTDAQWELIEELLPGRAIATRYDKTARNFLGAIHLVAAIIWMI